MSKAGIVDSWESYLNPTTFNPMVGASWIRSWVSTYKGTTKRRAACAAMKRITAMTSWAKRKKSGAAVVLRTHLFLYFETDEWV